MCDIRIVVLDHPGQMRMQKSGQSPEQTFTMQVRRVQVAFMIGEFVVPAVHRDP
jgi:hypothetical protein